MKTIYLSLLSLLTLSLSAQPTITSAWAPDPGAAYHSRYNMYAHTRNISPGASGTNVTWNLNFSSSVVFIGADSTDWTGSQAFSWPAATEIHEEIINGQSSYYYHKKQGNTYKYLGMVRPGTPTDNEKTVFATPLDVFQFPLTYNTTYQCQGYYDYSYFTSSGFGQSHGGTLAISQVDGYGRLNTPAGGFINVLRVHTLESTDDTINIAFQTYNISYTSVERYDWICADRPGIILASVRSATNNNGTFYYNYYSKVTPTAPAAGIESIHSDDADISLYPQPASDRVSIALYNTTADATSVSIYDLAGREVLQQPISISVMESHFELNTSTLADGIYTLAIYSADATSTRKLVVRH